MRKKKTPRQKLKAELDKLSKQYIKMRDNHICQKCGKPVKDQDQHWSHVVPKSAGNRLRWEPLNLKVLCMYCHQWWHKNPIESGRWFMEKFPERYVFLEQEKQKGAKKFTMDELEELRDWYIRSIENF